jgi:hypothetical protein
MMTDPSGHFGVVELALVAATLSSFTEFDLARIRIGFSFSASAGWKVLRELGATVEANANKLVKIFANSNEIETGVRIRGAFGKSYIDTMAKIGEEVIYVESKSQLPAKSGAALTRLSKQMGNLITSADRIPGSAIYVFAERILDAEESLRRIIMIRSNILTRLGSAGKVIGPAGEVIQIAEEVQQIKFVLGYAQLAEELELLVTVL